MHVLHANWSGSRLHLWAESAAGWAKSAGGAGAAASGTPAHPFALPAAELAGLAHGNGGGVAVDSAPAELELALPESDGRPSPSDRLAHAVGHSAHGDG